MSGDGLVELFEELLRLPLAEREARLSQLSPTPATATRLRSLLQADQRDDALIGDAIAIAVEPEAEPMPDPAGMRIGAWRVLRELGSGGMGTVLLAERDGADFSQQVAIKLIRGFASGDGVRRLRQERQILAALDHPAIARLIDGGETDAGQPYLVMEYVVGQTLDAWLAASKPDRDRCLQLFERICAAVQHAHQHLVVHRDLKPANVMVTAGDEVKLLDFGVAKLIAIGGGEDDSRSTRVYTAAYASPEQKLGLPISIASDIYSLGIMLEEVLRAVLGAGGLAADAELSGIINKAIAERPSRRYATVAAFAADLVRYRQGLPVAATPNTRRYRLRKWIARHRLATVASLLAFATITVLIAYLVNALGSAQLAREEAQQNLARARAVIGFFADMFEGVAPEHALGRALAPAELLSRAERQLHENPPADPGLRSDLSAAIASLYQRMGDGDNSVRLFEASLADQVASDRESALELANRHSQLSIVLADLDRNEEALSHVEQANQLRQSWLADDAALALQSELDLARALIGVRRDDDAIQSLARADALTGSTAPEPRAANELHRLRATLAVLQGRFEQGLSESRAALELLQQHPELPQTLGIELERMQGMSARGAGRLLDADAAFARAIALQKKLVGDSGVRAYGLHNDHAIVLASLGRFRDAREAYQHAARIFEQVGGPAAERNPRHLNNVCDSEIGIGEYPSALGHCSGSAAILLAERPADDPDRLQVESNLARATALAGDPRAALTSFDSIIARSAENPGFPLGLHAWRAARVELMLGDTNAARRRSEQALEIFRQAFPSPHIWIARGLRLRALVQLASGQPGDADTTLQQALAEAAPGLPPSHPLIAQLVADRARAAADRGDADAARSLLQQALPVLRDCCVRAEIDRAAAEALQQRLGSPTMRPVD